MLKKLITWFKQLFNDAVPNPVIMSAPVPPVIDVVDLKQPSNPWFQQEGVFPTIPAAPASNVILDAVNPTDTFAQYINAYMRTPQCPGWKYERIRMEFAAILAVAHRLNGSNWEEKLNDYFKTPTTVTPSTQPSNLQWPLLYDGSWFTTQAELDDYKTRVARRQANLEASDLATTKLVYHGPVPASSLSEADQRYLYSVSLSDPKCMYVHFKTLNGTHGDISRAINYGFTAYNGFNGNITDGVSSNVLNAVAQFKATV